MLQKVLAANGDRAVYPSLIGKKVLITGGATGIGAGLVEAFVAQGCETAFVDKDEAPAHALVAKLTDQTGFTPRFHHCDLTDLEGTAGAFGAIFEEFGRVDILVNNAANDDRHAVAEVTPAYWDERMAVNLKHLFFAAQAVIPGMKAQGGGSIINFGSISWHLGLMDLTLYQTAKAAIEGMTRSLARELGRDGIRVNAIIPGNVQTPRQEKWYTPEGEAEIVAAQCLNGRVQPRDVAAMALFLASDDAHMCTGHNYWVDAGWR
ncbi:MAG: SDR family oxidoreductase [Sphingobium sp.]|nr:SDR family oxidoreductase [Sphingobium sp.]